MKQMLKIVAHRLHSLLLLFSQMDYPSADGDIERIVVPTIH